MPLSTPDPAGQNGPQERYDYDAHYERGRKKVAEERTSQLHADVTQTRALLEARELLAELNPDDADHQSALAGARGDHEHAHTQRTRQERENAYADYAGPKAADVNHLLAVYASTVVAGRAIPGSYDKQYGFKNANDMANWFQVRGLVDLDVVEAAIHHLKKGNRVNQEMADEVLAIIDKRRNPTPEPKPRSTWQKIRGAMGF